MSDSQKRFAQISVRFDVGWQNFDSRPGEQDLSYSEYGDSLSIQDHAANREYVFAKGTWLQLDAKAKV